MKKQNSGLSGEYIMATETTTLGGGCFWCLEAVFDELNGVTDVVSGYAGGPRPNPTYEAVCSGTTGHAEVIQVKFDPEIVSYEDILHVFFAIHDPTTLNRQGGDMGTQYRSVIFTHSPEQKATAEQVMKDLSAENLWPNPIVTQLAEAPTFYAAEYYHQEYYARSPNAGYCQVVIAPKVSKFRKHYFDKLKKPTI